MNQDNFGGWSGGELIDPDRFDRNADYPEGFIGADSAPERSPTPWMSDFRRSLEDALTAAKNATAISRSVRGRIEATLTPEPPDATEALAMANAVDYLAWCVSWMASELLAEETER